MNLTTPERIALIWLLIFLLAVAVGGVLQRRDDDATGHDKR